ncbi:MAG: polya polymerase [Oribacterium sp.]|nr:polya polymerase [Oribacterium sp.]MBO6308958.1 polya polymerase [Oribacterium sp.]MBR1857389.1 polya polymerase [Oribacterium sp.]
MKLENVSNVEGLFKVLDSCKGKIELVSEEGDRINLKSKLSQMILTANLLNTATIKELELLVSDPEDMKKVISFMMRGSAE